MSNVDFDLNRLLAPIAVETFLREYWEKAPLFIRRDDPFYYRDLLSLEGVDKILSTSSLLSTNIRIVRNGRETPLNSLLGGRQGTLGLEQVYAEYREGSTIVLQFIHDCWTPLTRFCATLATELSAGVQANGYLTPRNAQGLGIHYDTHDVFVLQVEGSKHWRLFDSPLRLPLAGQLYQKDKHIPSTEPQELDLNAGDLLYVPRGFIHEVASKEATSLHLTVGILSIPWAETILAAVETVIERDSKFRESMPPGFAREESLRSEADVQLAELLKRLIAGISTQEVIANAIGRAKLARRPMLEGHLLDLEAETSISLSTLVRRRPNMQWALYTEDDNVVLQFHGKNLQMPKHIEPDVRWIVETDEPFTGNLLPGQLTEDGRLVLIRRLLHEGFLKVGST